MTEVERVDCSAEDCLKAATVAMMFKGVPGHVHVCPQHEAIDREWCDIISSHDLPCQFGNCEINLGKSKPPPLENL